MSIPGSLTPLFNSGAGGAAGYQIERSLRFNSADSAYLSRTPGTASNRKTWTWAAWVKRSALGSAQNLFRGGAGTSNSTYVALYFANDDIKFGGWASNFITTTAVFRDCSAWYHIVLTVDTTLTSNRIKLYVNNVEQAITQDGGYPAQNDDLGVNLAQLHTIGGNDLASGYANHYLAECYLIDGQALTPSSFTEVSATTGQLIPKAYSGTFGTNGFWLKFSDNSAATAATLGKDYSGNSNNWTPNNLSVTAGAGNDSLVDSPTSYGTDTGVGNEVRGNYATLNPLFASGGSGTLTNGNLDSSYSSGGWYSRVGTIYASSGKYYWEHTITAGSTNKYVFTGIATPAYNGADFPGSGAGNSYAWYGNEGNLRPTAQAGWNVTYDNGDVIGVALDMDNGKLYFSKNGTFVNSSNPAAQTNPQVTGLAGYAWAPAISYFTGYGGTVNFGQRAFAYTAPSGFKALCDTNLGAPLIAKPNTLMDVVTRAGGGTTQTFATLRPGLVWEKRRDSSSNHYLFDVNRGNDNYLSSNLTSAEAASAGAFTFNTNSYTVSSGFDWPGGATVVDWVWDAGSSTVSNPDGSITSQVRANASAGFSVVTYSTGASSGNQTIGHGLNVTPSLIIHKVYSTTSNWWVYHASTTNTVSKYIQLNSTNATADNVLSMWGAALPTSTVFGANVGQLLQTNQSAVAYCFAPVVGYSSFGSYTGNGSADGPFVHLGFLPRWILFKKSSASQNWHLIDTARDPYNIAGNELYPDLSLQESGGYGNVSRIDVVSNGFKIRTSNDGYNGSAGTYIFAAFAQNPFQYSRAR